MIKHLHGFDGKHPPNTYEGIHEGKQYDKGTGKDNFSRLHYDGERIGK
jgi:hypothetical protein